MNSGQGSLPWRAEGALSPSILKRLQAADCNRPVLTSSRAREISLYFFAELKMNEKPQLDVLLIGLPRSGTTMMANLMTDINRNQICLVEPGPFGGPFHPKAARQISLLGHQPESEKTSDILKALRKFDRCGVKEVQNYKYMATYEQLKPAKVALCLRDPRDCVVSLYELWRKQERSKSFGREADAILSCTNSISNFLQNNQIEPVLIYYDKICKSEEEIQKVAEQLDWPLTGDPGLMMDHYKCQNEIRNGVFSRRPKSDRKKHLEMVKLVQERCAEFIEKYDFE